MCSFSYKLFLIVVFYLLQECHGFHLLNNLPEILSRNKRQACSRNDFKCRDKLQCIPKYEICDGKTDCSDGSDEIECKRMKCPSKYFKCKYGACINMKQKCNGQSDCVDNSDEDPILCGYTTTTDLTTTISTSITTQQPWTPPTRKADCILPKQPNHGHYEVLNVRGQPGTSVPEYTTIKYSCAPPSQYQLTTDASVFTCLNGQWSFSTEPSCLATCPPRVAKTIDITCQLNGHFVNCSQRMLEGTKIHMTCKPYHEPTTDIYAWNEATCHGGTWDHHYLRCTPECGKLDKIGQQLCINCTTATIYTHPWHVGIYKEEKGEIKHKCGGSIINPIIVLSAAHCFTDMKGAEQPIDLFHIAAQKNFRDFNDPKDTDAQKRKARKILIPNVYYGITRNFAADIAVIVLNKPFELNYFVTSVCLDLITVDYVPEANTTGKVAGWGYTEEEGGLSDNRLKELTVPVIMNDNCHLKVPLKFQSFVTSDKICAGYQNGSSVCQGDSGGGLVVLDRRKDLYYVRGVVSTGPVKGQWCNNFEITAYTNVASHRGFLKKIIHEEINNNQGFT